MRSMLVLVATLGFSVLVAGQSPAPGDSRPRFDSASVKPNRSPEGGIINRFSPGRFTYLNTTLESFVYNAYPFPPDRVVGMPDWARREKFDITATHSPEYAEFSQQQRAMLQRLLEERFSLRVHRETRELPVYELVLVRSDSQLGPRLRVETPECAPGGTADRAQCGTRMNAGLLEGKSVDWRVLAGVVLPGAVGRAVIDKTGLKGRYDIKLEWSPDPSASRSPEAVAQASAAAATPGERVSIFTALPEQLGVKLQDARAPLEVLVIDKLERPTPD